MEDTFRSVDGAMSIVDSDGNVTGVDDQGRLKLSIYNSLIPHTLSGTNHTGQLLDSQIPDDITRDSELTTTSGDIVSQIPLDHSDVYDDDTAKHRLINDSSSSSTELLSSSEVDSRIITASGSLQDQIDSYDEHNELKNIQGGAVDEYYHLDEATYNDIITSDDIEEFYEYSNGESSTTSETFQTKVDLDFTVTQTGYFKVIHGFLMSMGDTGIFHKSRINYDSGTYFNEKFSELYNYKYDSGAWHICACIYVLNITSTGSHSIELQYASDNAGKTAYIKEAHVSVQRINT